MACDCFNGRLEAASLVLKMKRETHTARLQATEVEGWTCKLPASAQEAIQVSKDCKA